jgi:catechol 2,3-dioxygenase-like lactoylglutathione lyase family enzyme
MSFLIWELLSALGWGMGLVPTGTGKLIAVFDHVTIRAADLGASERFYDTVLATIGVTRTHSGEALAEWDDFSLAPRHILTPAGRVHGARPHGLRRDP